MTFNSLSRAQGGL